jgi:hypothetical protein
VDITENFQNVSESERFRRKASSPTFFPQAQPKSRAHAVLSATADLDDDDLDEVVWYAQFRKAQRPAKRRR